MSSEFRRNTMMEQVKDDEIFPYSNYFRGLQKKIKLKEEEPKKVNVPWLQRDLDAAEAWINTPNL